MMAASLPAIAALARAGALERAWELFVAGGHDQRSNDAASLALKGRLLKGRARTGGEAVRSSLYLAAASAYAAANALEPAPYHAINVASSLLFAGEDAAAHAEARAVLTMLDAPGPPADTPYYLAATRAEALLLLGDEAAACTAMEMAARADPDGWADRATTIAQLEDISRAVAPRLPWLDSFRPPASLHFAGHMGLSADSAGEAMLAARIDALIAQHRIGFAFGCAAAGCDIVIGERVLAAGGELTLFLPAPVELFERQSITPAGDVWSSRFRTLLVSATDVVVTGRAEADGLDPALHDPLATRLAGAMAIGEALMQARRLASRSVQVVALDPDGGGPHSAGLAAIWPDAASSHRIEVPREVAVRAVFAGDIAEPARRLAVILRIRLSELSVTQSTLEAACAPIWQVLAGIDPVRIAADAHGWEVMIDDPGEAAVLALRIVTSCRTAAAPLPFVGIAYGPVCVVRDALNGRLVPHGVLAREAMLLSASAQTGTVLASRPFALSLAVQSGLGARCELSHLGEGGPNDAVYLVLSEAV